jgi:hypothetical protein
MGDGKLHAQTRIERLFSIKRDTEKSDPPVISVTATTLCSLPTVYSVFIGLPTIRSYTTEAVPTNRQA